jgi:hypothetical protein
LRSEDAAQPLLDHGPHDGIAQSQPAPMTAQYPPWQTIALPMSVGPQQTGP